MKKLLVVCVLLALAEAGTVVAASAHSVDRFVGIPFFIENSPVVATQCSSTLNRSKQDKDAWIFSYTVYNLKDTTWQRVEVRSSFLGHGSNVGGIGYILRDLRPHELRTVTVHAMYVPNANPVGPFTCVVLTAQGSKTFPDWIAPSTFPVPPPSP